MLDIPLSQEKKEQIHAAQNGSKAMQGAKAARSTTQCLGSSKAASFRAATHPAHSCFKTGRTLRKHTPATGRQGSIDAGVGRQRPHVGAAAQSTASSGGLQALIFDCDGVIVESENIHRMAYNATFRHFDVRCPGSEGPLVWSEEYYEDLQNRVGGGKPKMRHYFSLNGWPTSSMLGAAPSSETEQAKLIDALQDWKTEKYKDIISSGEVSARPGVLRLMAEAQAAGVPVAICSAATKNAVEFVLGSLLGAERFQGLDLFMAGDDVKEKKPDPTIYKVAAQRLSVNPGACLVIEDSTIGLAAALGAGMRCLVTYTSSTRSQDFAGADCVVSTLDGITFAELTGRSLVGKDDRVTTMAATAS